MIDKPDKTPSHAEGNGRDSNGRFGKGNKAGKGNPHLRRVRQLKAALLKEVKPQDVARVIRAMIESAAAGDPAAAKIVLERAIGKVTEKIQMAGELRNDAGIVLVLPDNHREFHGNED